MNKTFLHRWHSRKTRRIFCVDKSILWPGFMLKTKQKGNALPPVYHRSEWYIVDDIVIMKCSETSRPSGYCGKPATERPEKVIWQRNKQQLKKKGKIWLRSYSVSGHTCFVSPFTWTYWELVRMKSQLLSRVVHHFEAQLLLSHGVATIMLQDVSVLAMAILNFPLASTVSLFTHTGAGIGGGVDFTIPFKCKCEQVAKKILRHSTYIYLLNISYHTLLRQES